MATQTPIIILVKMMITIIIFEWFYIIFPIQNSEEPILQKTSVFHSNSLENNSGTEFKI
jgi:hypothetical protein